MYRANRCVEWDLLFGLQEAVILRIGWNRPGTEDLFRNPESPSDGVLNHVAAQTMAYHPARFCRPRARPGHQATGLEDPAAARHGRPRADPGRNPTQQQPVSESHRPRRSSGCISRQPSEQQYYKCAALRIAAFLIVRSDSDLAPDSGSRDAGGRRHVKG
jgi:hypothetical protein